MAKFSFRDPSELTNPMAAYTQPAYSPMAGFSGMGNQQYGGGFGNAMSDAPAANLYDAPTIAEAVTAPNMWQQFKDGFRGSTDTKTGIKTDGFGGLAIGAASGLMGGYLGMQQLDLARDSAAEAKRQFGMNWDAQRTSTNTSLRDRQAARVASNPGAYQSVGEYMNQNRIA